MAQKDRFGFLDEVAAEPRTADITPTSQSEQGTPYLFQQHSRTEPQAPLGNRVRLAAKHVLEDYVRSLKRAGYPATEARVMEAMMLLLNEDEILRTKVTAYLTGKPE